MPAWRPFFGVLQAANALEPAIGGSRPKPPAEKTIL
jgi:hypothetical protein